MKIDSVVYSKLDVLTVVHRGIGNAEGLMMVGLLDKGYDLCLVTSDDDPLLIIRWEVIREDGVGQMIGVSESRFTELRDKNFQCEE